MSNRGSVKLLDGSLSDTQAAAYGSSGGDAKPDYSSYAMWLKHSNTASSRLSEGDALDQMQIVGGSPNIGRNHKFMQQTQSHSQSPRLNRSNSIR
jgi:hypothetical protein